MRPTEARSQTTQIPDAQHAQPSDNPWKIPYFAREASSLLKPQGYHHGIFLEMYEAPTIKVHRARQQIVEDISQDVSDEELAKKLNLHNDNFQLVLTVIGDAKYQDESLGRIVTHLLSYSLLDVARHMSQKNKKMAVLNSATLGGAMWAISEARLYHAMGIGKGDETYANQDPVDYQRSDFAFIGFAPKEHVLHQINNITEQDLMSDVLRYVATGRQREWLSPHASHAVITTNEEGLSEQEQWNIANRRIDSFGSYLNRNNHGAAVSILAGGGEGSAFEIAQKLRHGEKIIVIKSTGRLADAITALKEGHPLSAEEQTYIDLVQQYSGKPIDPEELRTLEIFDPFAYDHPSQAAHALSSLVTTVADET